MSATSSLRLFGASPPPGRQSVSVELETVDCLLCGDREHETVIVAGDQLTQIGGHFRVVRCHRCQLAFTNPRPTAGSLGLFYPADYAPYSENEPSGRLGASWRRALEIGLLRHRFGYPPQPSDARAALTSWVARAVIRRPRAQEHWFPFRAPGRLLDFGCGTAEFLTKMREYGWNVEGLDLSPRVVDALRQNSGCRAHLGTLPHPDIPASSVDAMTMWHSLEHVPFPQEVLRAASDALRTGGILAVSVPNFASWSFRQFHEHWQGLALPRHLTHFTPLTLRRMVEAVGFRVLSVDQVGRDGWIRKSARRALQSRDHAGWTRVLRWKWLASSVARWTELTGQADSLRLIAEKV